MKKTLAILLVLAFCISLTACKTFDVFYDDISVTVQQGSWERYDESTGMRIRFTFNNGNVTRVISEDNGGSTTLTGTYTIEKPLVSVTYSDGTTQGFYVVLTFGDDGMEVLQDANTSERYSHFE